VPTPLEDVTTLLAQIETPGSFATHDTAAPDDLRLSVTGVGRVRLPVTVAQARDLIAVARPARHGFKAETRLDPRVRDTWEVPKSRIAIDRRAWERTLGPRLETIRRDLGLPAQCRLKAEPAQPADLRTGPVLRGAPGLREVRRHDRLARRHPAIEFRRRRDGHRAP
jgi:hypothetical protein